MHVSDAGLRLITHFEGFPNGGRPYNDPVGLATVGYGHLIARRRVNDADRRAVWLPGQREPGRLTQPEAIELLKDDLGTYERAVDTATTRRMTQCEFDALVSFTYNLGAGSLRSSTLLRKFNAGDQTGAANEFGRWVKAGGRTLDGLVRRRAAERALFASPNPDPFDGYPPEEVTMLRTYDALRRQHVHDERLVTLVARMTTQRKRIWHAGEHEGWDANRRRARYHSLLARTR
jgi:lysozyme